MNELNWFLFLVLIEDVKFRVTWNATNQGLCDVKLFLSFVQNGTNLTQNVTVHVASGIYENCNLKMINVTSVRYKTIVMYDNKTLNSDSNFSEEITFQKMTTNPKSKLLFFLWWREHVIGNSGRFPFSKLQKNTFQRPGYDFIFVVFFCRGYKIYLSKV